MAEISHQTRISLEWWYRPQAILNVVGGSSVNYHILLKRSKDLNRWRETQRAGAKSTRASGAIDAMSSRSTQVRAADGSRRETLHCKVEDVDEVSAATLWGH